MATMDLSVIHQNQDNKVVHFAEDYENKLSKIKETILETDVKRNNNLFNSSKTEASSDLHQNPDSLFQEVTYISKESLKVENTIFSYASFQKAMDLTTHCRSNGETKRTIFEDADYFSKNYMYKLLPITFENVDEAIIHTEHNYCHASLSSGSELDEDCSRTMDYSQIKEKNYKKRKAKNDQSADEETSENQDQNSLPLNFSPPINGVPKIDQKDSNPPFCTEEKSTSSQPLDLSAPLVQEKKTDVCLKLHESSIVSSHVSEKEDASEFDSDKENQKANMRCIEVTITRPDEKENYEPCDLFLNDIARLVPKLIKKDCFEIEILDRTLDYRANFQKHRLYYIISQTTWQLFRSANERVILTNDQSLGQLVQKTEESEKPTFIIFDQISLAKCLAEYCEEIGGCFEYTRVEETKDGGYLKMNQEIENSGVEVRGEKIEKKELIPVEVPCTVKLEKVEEKLKEEECATSQTEKLKDDVKDEKAVSECKDAKVDFSVNIGKRKNERRESLRRSKVIKTEAKSSVSEKKPTIIKNPKVDGDSVKEMQDSIVREIKTRLKSISQPGAQKTETSQKSSRVVEKKETSTKRKAENPLRPIETPKIQKLSPVSEISFERKTRSGKILKEIIEEKSETVTESIKKLVKETNEESEKRTLRSMKKEEVKIKESESVNKEYIKKKVLETLKKVEVKNKSVENVKKVEVKNKSVENVKKENGKKNDSGSVQKEDVKKKNSGSVQKEVISKPETRQSARYSLKLRSRTNSRKDV